MRVDGAVLTCIALVSIGWSEPININGAVKESATQNPVSGVILRLVANRLIDTTDASGAFSFVGTTAGVSGDGACGRAGFIAPVLAPGNGIRLGLVEPGRVLINGYMVDGRQMFRYARLLPAGEHVIGCGVAAPGVVIYRVSSGGKTHVIRRTDAGARDAADDPGNGAGASVAWPAKAGAGFSDTIVAAKAKYVTKRVVVSSSTTAGLTIELTPAPDGETVTDIDGNVYHAVTIGAQVWTVENLKTSKYNDGKAIPVVTDGKAWSGLQSGACCVYGNSDANKEIYGLLYNWHAVGTNKLAPAGWHVASDTDWTRLVTGLGGNGAAGGKLKEAGTTHWMTPNGGATNESGFTALPGGYRYTNGAFTTVGSNGFWWSSTSAAPATAWFRSMNNYNPSISRDTYGKANGYSVRCVKD